jgi:hypothetical protein
MSAEEFGIKAGCQNAFGDSVDIANAGVLKKRTEYLSVLASWSLLPFNIVAIIPGIAPSGPQ